MLKSKLFKKKLGFQEVQFSCSVTFLTEQESLTVAYNKDWLGEEVFDRVCTHLNLAEKHFFGLRYDGPQNQRIWLDLKKPIQKQLKNGPWELDFRVRYYPSDPLRLKEQLTRYLLFLQLERDLKHGKLLCTSSELIHLSAFQLQAKFGGAMVEPEETDLAKVFSKNARYLLNDILIQRNSILDMSVTEAEKSFVQLCSRLATYGIEPSPARDVLGEIVFVGVNHGGVLVLKEGKVVSNFLWRDISRLDYHGKLLSIQCKGGTQHIKCASSDVCKNLWKLLLDQQNFFTLEWSGDAKKVRANRGLFRRTSSFRFKGLCESDVWRSVTSLNRIEPPVVRSFSGLSHNLSGSHSVPPSILQASYHTDLSGSLRSTSPLASPLLPRHLETAAEEEEETTPKAEEDEKAIQEETDKPDHIMKSFVERGLSGSKHIGDFDDDFYSISEHSQIDQKELDLMNQQQLEKKRKEEEEKKKKEEEKKKEKEDEMKMDEKMKMVNEVKMKEMRMDVMGLSEDVKKGDQGDLKAGEAGVGGGCRNALQRHTGFLQPLLNKHVLILLFVLLLYALLKLQVFS